MSNETGGQPQDIDLNSLLIQMLNKILPGMLTGGGAFTPMMSGFLKDATGVSGDPAWDTTFISPKTPYGINNARLDRVAAQIGTNAMQGTGLAAQQQFYRSVIRTLNTEAGYNELKDAGKVSASSYNMYIEDKLRDAEDNKLLGTLYTMLDPMDMNAVRTGMGTAATNMIRGGASAGDRNIYAKTSEVLRNFLTDKDGKLAMDPKQYGGMGRGEIATLTSALTRDTDFLKGVEFDPKSLGVATERLRAWVQDYAKALSPLKDIFGKDMAGMLRTVEELSGQTISQMGADRVHQVATRALDSVGTGKYSMQNVTAASAAIATQLQAMDVPVLNRLNASLYATQALDAARGGVMPSFMTSAGFTEHASRLTMGTANSNASDNLAKGYAMWVQQQPAEGDKTFPAFLKKAQAIAGSNGNLVDAVMGMVGVTTVQGLEQGLAFGSYTDAKRSGDADAAIRESYVGRGLRLARYAMSRDQNVHAALKRATEKEYSEEQTSDAFDDLTALLDSNPEMIQGSEKDNRSLLASKNISQAKINEMMVMFNMFQNGKNTAPILAYMAANSNSRRQAAARTEAESRRGLLEKFTGEIAGDWKGFFTETALGKGEGYTTGTFNKIVGSSMYRDMAGSEGDKEEMAVLLAAGAGMAKSRDEDDRGAFVNSFFNYANSAAGLGNIGFRTQTTELVKLRRARSSASGGDAEALDKQIQQHTRLLDLYYSGEPQLIAGYIGTGADSDKRLAQLAELVGTNKTEGAINFLKHAKIQEQMKGPEYAGELQLYNAYLTSNQMTDTDKFDTEKWATFLKNSNADNYTKDRAAALIKEALRGTDSATASSSDIFGGLATALNSFSALIPDLADAIKELTGVVDKDKTKEENSAKSSTEATKASPHK